MHILSMIDVCHALIERERLFVPDNEPKTLLYPKENDLAPPLYLVLL